MNGPQDIVDANRKLYKKRRDVLVESFGRAGWDIPVPQASMFAWAPIPEQFRELGSMEFAKKLLTEAHVAVAPGVGFGEEGEGFVRIALVENEQRLRQAAARREEDAWRGLALNSPAADPATLGVAPDRPVVGPPVPLRSKPQLVTDRVRVDQVEVGSRQARAMTGRP